MSRNREPLRDDAERVGHLISRRADDYAAMGDVERRAQVADEMAAADRDGTSPASGSAPAASVAPLNTYHRERSTRA